MAKRFKFAGETCVYCALQPATTADHVFSRQFFVVKQRDNLPQVPACQGCNNAKSRLEHYLTAVLAFGGRHADAAENLTTLVPRRLEENQALHRRLEAGLVQPDAEAGSPMTISFEPEKLNALFGYIAKGLAWHHWGVRIGHDSAVWAGLLSGGGETLFEHLFGHNCKERVTANLGDGTFRYQGAQSGENPQMTIWRFSLYGGALFSGDPEAPEEFNSVVGAVTGSAALIDRFVRLAAGESEPAT